MTQTIEQLTARVRELEEENARLVKLDAKRKKQLSDFDAVIDDLNVAVSCINPVEDLKELSQTLKNRQPHRRHTLNICGRLLKL